MEELMAKMQEWLAEYGLKVVGAVIILVIGVIVAKIIRSLLRRILQKGHADEMLVSFISSLCYFGILAFVIIAALGKLGVETGSFVAVLAAAGLAIGFALQGTLSNFAAGFMLIVFKPFKVGDFIEGGGVTGVVEGISIFTTELKTPDNKKIIVPNSKLSGDNITNYTAKEIRRVDLVIGVSYNDNLDKVRKVLEDILASDNRILKDPAPTIGVLALADSSINFAVRPWVKTANYWDVFFATQETIKKRFDAEGICIPFPQQDVHLHKAE
ncbi:MAG: mechanosensitive ion channel [Planctomycetes bacterium]|nr:mechanosensitive ion channel [Planctomycetota bacterium]